ncbi:uncharacterized protein LOC135931570 isoform X2 [Gordionus sp. m RMFG-2023]|uniref:uncharacterized protein LOC135931570 isoform X2 n=1 Tax=Gordionus sp. m RMFG-2023 TaxID=3053472 RepID=UPI0031FE1FDD
MNKFSFIFIIFIYTGKIYSHIYPKLFEINIRKIDIIWYIDEELYIICKTLILNNNCTYTSFMNMTLYHVKSCNILKHKNIVMIPLNKKENHDYNKNISKCCNMHQESENEVSISKVTSNILLSKICNHSAIRLYIEKLNLIEGFILKQSIFDIYQKPGKHLNIPLISSKLSIILDMGEEYQIFYSLLQFSKPVPARMVFDKYIDQFTNKSKWTTINIINNTCNISQINTMLHQDCQTFQNPKKHDLYKVVNITSIINKSLTNKIRITLTWDFYQPNKTKFFILQDVALVGRCHCNGMASTCNTSIFPYQCNCLKSHLKYSNPYKCEISHNNATIMADENVNKFDFDESFTIPFSKYTDANETTLRQFGIFGHTFRGNYTRNLNTTSYYMSHSNSSDYQNAIYLNNKSRIYSYNLSRINLNVINKSSSSSYSILMYANAPLNQTAYFTINSHILNYQNFTNPEVHTNGQVLTTNMALGDAENWPLTDRPPLFSTMDHVHKRYTSLSFGSMNISRLSPILNVSPLKTEPILKVVPFHTVENLYDANDNSPTQNFLSTITSLSLKWKQFYNFTPNYTFNESKFFFATHNIYHQTNNETMTNRSSFHIVENFLIDKGQLNPTLDLVNIGENLTRSRTISTCPYQEILMHLVEFNYLGEKELCDIISQNNNNSSFIRDIKYICLLSGGINRLYKDQRRDGNLSKRIINLPISLVNQNMQKYIIIRNDGVNTYKFKLQENDSSNNTCFTGLPLHPVGFLVCDNNITAQYTYLEMGTMFSSADSEIIDSNDKHIWFFVVISFLAFLALLIMFLMFVRRYKYRIVEWYPEKVGYSHILRKTQALSDEPQSSRMYDPTQPKYRNIRHLYAIPETHI